MVETIDEKLKAAVLQGNLELVEFLLYAGGDVNYCSPDHFRTLLHLCPDSKIAKLLVKNGAVVNAADRYRISPLCYAVASRKTDLVKVLLSLGASVGIEGTRNPLNFAPTSEIAIELLSYGADVNACDTLRRTPLHSAMIDKREFSLIRTLMDAGADINLKLDNFGNTFLHYADSLDIVRELLLRGCDVNAVTTKRQTPLHCAVKHMKETAIVREILKYGVNVNALDNEGNTALIYAIRSHRKNVDVIKLLMEYRADITIASFDYNHFRFWTPLDSVIHNDLSIARLLIKLALLKYINTFLITNYINSNMPVDCMRKLKLYLSECSSEIKKMKSYKICNNIRLFDISTRRKFLVRPLYRSFKSLEEEMFINYPIYHDIIMPTLISFLERGRLFNKLKEVQFYFLDSRENKTYLNTDCVLIIAEYLPEESLYNLLLSFDS